MGTLKSIKTKLSNNNAMIAKADKGSSIAILKIQDYDNKINNFITQNNFLAINTDPTNSFQNTTRKITNSIKILIAQEHTEIPRQQPFPSYNKRNVYRL
jgi:hypothetical protein